MFMRIAFITECFNYFCESVILVYKQIKRLTYLHSFVLIYDQLIRSGIIVISNRRYAAAVPHSVFSSLGKAHLSTFFYLLSFKLGENGQYALSLIHI